MVNEKRFNYFVIVFLITILIVICLNPASVIADHLVRTSTGATSFTVNEDIVNTFNISINNTDIGQDANITQVNITLWGNFMFMNGSNGSSVSPNVSFTNSSAVLSWTNTSGYVINGSVNDTFFWFNATCTTPGTYNITVMTTNSSGVTQSNLSVTVNDTTPPNLIALNSPTPINNSIVIGTLYVNVSVIDNGDISAIIVKLFNSSRVMINSSSSSSNFTANFTGLTSGATYYYNVTVNDTRGNINSTITRQIVYVENSFEFNGTIRDINGNYLNATVINITVSSMGLQGPAPIAYYGATSNSTGWFNLTLPAYGSWMYKPVIRHVNSTTNAIDWVGPTVPEFPYSEFSDINGINFYLKQAGTINITAVNSSGSRITFFYQVKDTKLGYPIAYDFTNLASESIIYVPADRNYSVMVYPEESMPVSFNWNNFSSSSSYNFGAEYPEANLSKYNATTKTVHKQFNSTNNLVRINGYINVTGISGWDEFKVAAILLEPGNMVYLQYGILPYNMSAWNNEESDIYNLSTGFYNITVPGPAENQTILLFATARNGTSYYGGYKNVTISYSTISAQYNFTHIYGLLGDPSNLTMNNPRSQGTTNITYKKQTFNLLNSSNLTFTGNAHIESTVDYSSYGGIEFTFMEDVAANAGSFSIPLLNITGVKEFNIFASQGAPKTLSKTASQIINNNNLTINSFDPGDIGGALTNSQISVSMYISNSSCDVPSPDSSCLVTSSADLNSFNPLNAVIGGGALSFRMGTSSGILIHYVNVDMLASGPPDGLFENDAGTSELSSSFSNAMKFGSGGPTIYNYVLVSMPYVEGSSSTTGLNETTDVNLSIPAFYGQDANGNLDWTTPIWTSSNGTSASALAGNYSHYSTYASDWQVLMQSRNCTRTVGELSASNPCYVDTSNNRIWIRLPHFSGTAPTITGRIVTSNSSSSDSSSGGGSTSPSFWINTQSISEKQFETGFTTSLAKKYRLQFSVDKKFYYMGVVDVSSTSVTINLSAGSYKKVLNIGDEEKFDVSDDGYYDLSVKLNSINNSKASITIKKLNESIVEEPVALTPAPAATPTPATNNESIATKEVAKNGNSLLWIIGILVPVVVIFAIMIYISVRNGPKNNIHQKIKVYEF